MSKVKPTTKEQVIHYLLSNISLGTYDHKFVSNLESGFLGKGKPITTNQAALLNKIIVRYARQISKNELNYTELIKLPWTTPLVESAPEYTSAFAQISDDKIIIRTPYKSGFIKELKKFRTAKWLSDKREWHINYNENNLKRVVLLVAEYYDNINFCDLTKSCLEEAERYEHIKVWDPTLCMVNGLLLVAGINEPLSEAIKNIPLEITPKCFSDLTSYGIKISDGLVTTPVLEFAASQQFKIERVDLDQLIEYLPAIGCKNVVLRSSIGSSKDGVKGPYPTLVENLSEQGINVFTKYNVDLNSLSDYVVLYTLRLVISDLGSHATKLIQIINSEPVEIK